jgi:hypothetical protein
MEVAALVLEYFKVFLGFSVTVPTTILIFCLLFRSRIATALDAILEITFPGGSAKLERRTVERAAMEKYHSDAPAVVKAGTLVATGGNPDEIMHELLTILYHLSTLVLPLIPKADRVRFIEEATATLPKELTRVRTTLLKLADTAPEVHTLQPKEVLGLSDFVHAGE